MALFELHDIHAIPFYTCGLFWDCECEDAFIHLFTEDSCLACEARREEQPPSRVNEILQHAQDLPMKWVQLVQDWLTETDESPIPF
jgi:hypothetical protein